MEQGSRGGSAVQGRCRVDRDARGRGVSTLLGVEDVEEADLVGARVKLVGTREEAWAAIWTVVAVNWVLGGAALEWLGAMAALLGAEGSDGGGMVGGGGTMEGDGGHGLVGGGGCGGVCDLTEGTEDLGIDLGVAILSGGGPARAHSFLGRNSGHSRAFPPRAYARYKIFGLAPNTVPADYESCFSCNSTQRTLKCADSESAVSWCSSPDSFSAPSCLYRQKQMSEQFLCP